MRIVCPSCQAIYEVPESLLRGAPRRVRCARCAGEWTPPAADAVEPVGPAKPTPEPAVPLLPPPPREVPAPLAPPTRRTAATPSLASPAIATGTRRRGAVALPLLGWIVSLALLGGLAWAGYHWRDEVMAAWEPSRRLYMLLGLV